MNVLKSYKYGQIIYNSKDTEIGEQLDAYAEYNDSQTSLFKDILIRGDRVLEIGANYGTHTLLFSWLVGKEGLVLAYEPNRIPFYCLCGTVALNNITNIYCSQQFFGSSAGKKTIPELNQKIPQDFCMLNNHSIGANSCNIKMRKIDSIGNCDFIKINSGYSLDIINGGLDCLKATKPLIYVSTGEHSCLKKLKDIGYSAYIHTPRFYNNDNFADNEFNTLGNFCEQNMFFIHTEEEAEYELDYEQLDLDKYEYDTYNKTKKSLIEDVQYAKQDYVENLIGLAKVYDDHYKHDEAIDLLKSTFGVCEDPAIYRSIAGSYSRKCEWDFSEIYLKKALELDPGNEVTLLDLGMVLDCQRKYDEAIECFKKVNSNNAKWYLALSYLASRQYEKGWPLYEIRLKLAQTQNWIKALNRPYWRGEDLRHKTILLFNEQGAGDLLQMIRYVPLLKQRGAKVGIVTTDDMQDVLCDIMDFMLTCNDPTGLAVPQNKKLRIGNNIIDTDSNTLKIDYIVSIGSLPCLFKTTIDNIPEPAKINYESRELSGDKLKIGICWAGSPTYSNDNIRSCFLKDMEPLTELDADLYSFQKGDQKRTWINKDDVDLLKNSSHMKLENLKLDTLLDTVSYLKNMDCVVTVDTMIAHMAGTLGIPTYLAVWKINDFRWNTEVQSSWYSSIKICRSEKTWRENFEYIKSCIEKDFYEQKEVKEKK